MSNVTLRLDLRTPATWLCWLVHREWEEMSGPCPAVSTWRWCMAGKLPWTTCGFPAVTLPTGLSRSGLPVGIQLAAAPFAEERLLGAAHWCERVLDFRAAPPEPAQGATLT